MKKVMAISAASAVALAASVFIFYRYILKKYGFSSKDFPRMNPATDINEEGEPIGV